MVYQNPGIQGWHFHGVNHNSTPLGRQPPRYLDCSTETSPWFSNSAATFSLARDRWPSAGVTKNMAIFSNIWEECGKIWGFSVQVDHTLTSSCSMACKSLPFRGGKNGVTTDKLTEMNLGWSNPQVLVQQCLGFPKSHICSCWTAVSFWFHLLTVPTRNRSNVKYVALRHPHIEDRTTVRKPI